MWSKIALNEVQCKTVNLLKAVWAVCVCFHNSIAWFSNMNFVDDSTTSPCHSVVSVRTLGSLRISTREDIGWEIGRRVERTYKGHWRPSIFVIALAERDSSQQNIKVKKHKAYNLHGGSFVIWRIQSWKFKTQEALGFVGEWLQINEWNPLCIVVFQV